MKTISVIAILLSAFMGFSQTLPEDFEMSITTSDFTDFDGGVATVLANPQSSGINTSATVGQIVRNGGQIWAGSKYSLASNLDFTTLSNITMKVYTTAPIGTVVKFKLEDSSGGSTEVDVQTTATGSWEELTWDFTGTATSFNTIALMFDFGNVGDGTATSTFLFDDITQVGPTLSQIDLPVTFEDATVDYTMTDFGGNASMMVTDPTNPANTVMQVDKTAAAQLWAGTTISTSSGLASAIPFSATDTVITVRVWSPTSGTPIRLKVEDATNNTITCETEVNTTVASAWETLTFNFSAPVAGTPALNLSNTYDMASIFFNFGTDGATAGAQTYYFDDVMFGQPATPLSQIDLPVTFEDATVDYTMTDFGGNASMMVTDPTNPANTVMQADKTAAAQLWAGTTISTPAGFASVIPLTLTNSTMTVRVWSPTSGTPIRLKVENASDPTQTCETEVNTTVASAWETITFDFSNEVPGSALLSTGVANGWVFNMASIFFNFGTDGATAGAQTYYFDDVMFGSATTLSQIDLPVTFEDATVDYTMTDFGGNASMMVTDPTNPANTVMQADKTAAAQLWAGTTISTPAGFANPIPFSATDTIMTVRVWSPTAGTPIRLKVEDATNNTITCETEVNTTVASAWETLTFNFSAPVAGTPALNIANTYDMASIFFNFGTDGATAGAQTYYFDDVMFGQTATPLSQIDLPVTFEDATVDYTMTDFGGNASMMVTDPTNPANTVMQADKTAAAQLWAGTTISTPAGFANPIPFSATDTTMTVRVWSPTAGTPIRLKVEDATNNTITCETEVNTTVASAWETLTFNFSAPVAGTPALNLANTYDMASIFFNFGTDGATAGAQTYYFDDVMFGQTATPLSQIDLPVTFEDATVDYTMTDFGGNASMMVTDPTNPANTVMQADKTAAAQLWAGTTISTPAGFANPIPFSATDTTMTVRVWSPTAGTPIRLKVEDATNNTITCETEVNTTVASAWETLTFNFSNEVAGTPALNLTNTYDMASIFFNFGTDGATAGAQTYYFDDVMFGQTAAPLSQIDLPVTFEDATVDYTMTDFGGNASMMVTDPTDPTNTVMQADKTAAAQLWAGTTISTPAGLATAIPFTATETQMTVRVWSPTSGTPIRLKVEDATDNTITCETEVNTTMASAWETLTFDFAIQVAGTPALDVNNTYDMASIFFNFGTDGATAGAQTYYFDDVMFGQAGTPLSQIDLPVTFEDPTVDYTVTDFGGNASMMVTDPTDPTNTVMQSDKTGGAQLWAGTTISTPAGLATAIPFTVTETQMTVRVWSPTAGTPIRLKVEDATDNTITCETEVPTTVAAAWETLTFDFATTVAGTPALDINNTYDMASIFFNFGTDGATAGAQTYYFDDVMFGGTVNPLDQIDMPVTFEDAMVDYTMTDFGNNISTMITDPTNATNTVMEVVKPVTAEVWSGTSIGTPAGFATDIAFSATETFISVKVWSPTAGTPIRLKVENSADNSQTCETELMTTVAGDWETLVFDFSNEVAGTATLSDGLAMGWTYDLASIFFNFGTDGATAGEQTYYFDDVMFGDPFAGLTDLELTGLSVYPNPSSDQWTISSNIANINAVQVINLQGEIIMTNTSNSSSISIDASQLSSGVYLAYVSTDMGTSIRRMIKK